MTNEEAIKVLLDEWKCIDRNDGINCDRKCESCDLVMDSFVLKDAYNMAIKALQEQADRNEFYNWDAPIRHKADGEYISRKALLEDLYKRDYTKFTHRDFVALVQYQDIVAIPPEHDGCKDCVYQDNPQDAMPCRECKHNYMDKWKAKANKVGQWEYNQYDGNPNIGNWHCSECRNIVSDMPTCMGKPLYEFCPNCGCPMEIER